MLDKSKLQNTDKEKEFNKEIIKNDIKQARDLSEISDLLYVDAGGKLCYF